MVRKFGFVKPGELDPIDFVDTVNVFFLGPNAAIKEKNRKEGRKQFRSDLKRFGLRF